MSERYSERALRRRRVAVALSVFGALAATAAAFAVPAALSPYLFMAAGALYAIAGVQALPWITGEVESRTTKRDRGGW